MRKINPDPNYGEFAAIRCHRLKHLNQIAIRQMHTLIERAIRRMPKKDRGES